MAVGGRAESVSGPSGPVVFAYDGSELAGFAVERAGVQLAPDSAALVVCVWQPGDVGFFPVGKRQLRAAAANEVREAAEEAAAHGASLAERAGFRARSLAVEAAPTWRGIVDAAEACDADLIVIGSHQRTGVMGHLLGSVAAATVMHSPTSVLVVHRRS
jgi:nucleotide-binding universal stress UspA family protein